MIGFKTASASVLLFVFLVSAASAQSLVRRAAEIFENGCLSQAVLNLGNGSTTDEAAVAIQAVSNIFFTYDSRGTSRGLSGTPRYTVQGNQTSGRFHCAVASKNLTARQLARHFDRLSRVAANGGALPPIEPAQIDGDTSTHVEGQRRVFSSNGRELILEAIFFLSDRGPVGAFSMSLEHRIGN